MAAVAVAAGFYQVRFLLLLEPHTPLLSVQAVRHLMFHSLKLDQELIPL
jgi:hypothetical protein